MKFEQYTYNNVKSDKSLTIGNGITEGAAIRHLGIQIPYRPFVSFRHAANGDPYNEGTSGPCPMDVELKNEATGWTTDYIVNAPGILEFDDISLSKITITFHLKEDEVSNPSNTGLVLREVLVEAAIG